MWRMQRALHLVAAAVVVALAGSCTTDGGGSAEDAVVAALDHMRDGDTDEAWASLHPDEQARTDAASFAECVASQQRGPDAERPEHRVKAVHDQADPEVAGNTILGPARRVTIEFWDSEAEVRGGGQVIDFFAFHVGSSWRWADPHLDVANCARLPLD